MEKTWKFVCLCLIVSFLKLCNGLPINFERSITDPNVQLVSGLVAIVLTICTLLFVAGCLCCQRGSGFKDDKEEFRDSPVTITTSGGVDNGLVNPTADGAFTIFAPLSRQNLSASNERIRLDEEYTYGDINVSSWFNEGEIDFPRTKLKYIKELGKGWFGRVVEGTAQDLEKENTWTPVAVRILDSTASIKERVFFLHEAEIYKCGDHTNILKLYGRSLDSVPFLLLQEFCPQGDLKNYLISNKSNAANLLASEYPLIWCCQITAAIKFLHEKGIAHPDLACRNCQLTSNLTLKLGDYGLASSKYPQDYYEGIPTISVRWSAPESIRHTTTTIQSERITREANVWSLAVCFWEICECGEMPYDQLNDDEVINQVLGKASVRLARPSRGVLYTDYIYRLMQSCWLTPESRPTSTQIYLTLTDLLQVFTVCKAENQNSMDNSQGSQESFDMRWNSLKPNNLNTSDISAEIQENTQAKPMSPSLNNLIGSLDDVNKARQFEDDAHSTFLSNQSQHQKFEFKLGPQSKEPLEMDSLNDSMVFTTRRSSSSETEEENWKTKIERGAYTEKVRQKSRSVTDLMVLTHIDCSESESETPLASLDNKVNYKNVRLALKNNLDKTSYVHGSEGNLLSVQDDFQAELKKLQDERRDSLFFVPDNYSQNVENEQMNNNLIVDENNCVVESSSSDRLLKELNSTSEIKPANQVYNVFNVTIDKLSPVHIVKLNEIINLEEPVENKTFVTYEVPKLCDIIQNNSNVANLKGYTSEDEAEIITQEIYGNDELAERINWEAEIEVENLNPKITVAKENSSNQITSESFDKLLEDTCEEEQSSDLVDEIQIESDELKVPVVVENSDEKLSHELENGNAVPVNLENGIIEENAERIDEILRENLAEIPNIMEKLSFGFIDDFLAEERRINEINYTNDMPQKIQMIANSCQENSSQFDSKQSKEIESTKDKTKSKIKLHQVPKLIEIIENNDKLMDYIIANYESELNDDLSCENSYKTNSINNTIVVKTQATTENNDSDKYPVVDFDLSDKQELTNPNSLTHINVFTRQKSLDFISSTPTKKSFSSLSDDGNNEPVENTNLNYSLETWDNFLGHAIDSQNQNINDQAVVFESLTSEPRSLLFIEDDRKSMVTPPNSDIEVSFEDQPIVDVYENQTINIEPDDLNSTFVLDGQINETYSISDLDSTYTIDEDESASGTWESNGGWFLHPQSTGSVSGQITEQKESGSYVGFGMDEEILAALRGELLAKLPHAQGTSNDKRKENEEEWGPIEKDEVFLRYNVYNTPLSPILEESESEENEVDPSGPESPASGASDDWPEKFLEGAVQQDAESQSLKAQGLQNQHTLSQDSCCSNDTLFNLDDMTFVAIEQERETLVNEGETEKTGSTRLQEEQIQTDAINYFRNGTALGALVESPIIDLESPMEIVPDKTYLVDFLSKEREHSESVAVIVTEAEKDNQSDSNSSKGLPSHVAPLPSPDDHPWKQLSDSLLNYDRCQKNLLNNEESDEEESTTCNNENVENLYENILDETVKIEPDYTNIKENNVDVPSYVNAIDDNTIYQNIASVSDTVNEADYVNITNLENRKIDEEFDRIKSMDLNETYSAEYEETIEDADDLIIKEEEVDEDDQIFGVLTDIRFSGPGESHLMSTSFSESNELNNEQDWDSGSDTRSSSSGEFIWKEGEHEESLKALQALPQDTLDDMKVKESNREETSSDSSSCSDDEGECPEFIPSAWDKYATPTKSALRSPEKTLEKEEKKKGVWFKKQRYHCVYEYPREPESPVLQSFDFWNSPPPVTSYPEWYFDIDSAAEFNEFPTSTNLSDADSLSTDFNTTFSNEFYVTSSATPFDMMTSTTSQFFPGSENWSDVSKLNDNTTPDSGVEDVATPGSFDALDFGVGVEMASSKVPSLKFLAGKALTKLNQKENEERSNKVLGGLRHTRDKLKLDLPPSPNTFTSNKSFNLEPIVEPVVLRERPSFTTFGKSRFLVQHVDTPDKDTNGRNVCFEVLPYKPPEKTAPEQKAKKIKKEEKGEASLLDSADEDSGIESSTLERKTCDVMGKLIVD